MKTFYADDIRGEAKRLAEDLGIEVEIGERWMYGQDSVYPLTLNGVPVSFKGARGGSTDAIGGFFTALHWLDTDVVRDVFFRDEDTRCEYWLDLGALVDNTDGGDAELVRGPSTAQCRRPQGHDGKHELEASE